MTEPALPTTVRYGAIDQAFVDQMASVPVEEDGPVYMLNLMRYRPWADYAELSEGEPHPRITGREADDRYAPLGILAEIGASIVLFGDVLEQHRGDEGWDRVAVVRYPTRRSFLDMQTRADFIALHVHKDAGMERTIIALCQLATEAPRATASGGDVLLDLVTTAYPVDSSSRAHLDVEGTVVGDGRPWQTARLTTATPGATPVLMETDGEATSVTVRPLLDAF
jgi:hypothetical protein